MRYLIALALIVIIAKGKGGESSPTPAPRSIGEEIKTYATNHGIDPRVVHALIQVESGWNHSARGRAGEIGLAQLMPATARELGINPYDPIDNIRGAIKYLAKCKQLKGDAYIRCYNGGPGGTNLAQTYAYERKVLAKLQGEAR